MKRLSLKPGGRLSSRAPLKLGFLALLFLPGLRGQAFAGAWVLPKGQMWLRAGFMFQETEERYFLDGRRIPYFFEGQNRTLAAFFDFRRGLQERLEVTFQFPVYRIDFNDLADRRRSSGAGDLRLGLRYNLITSPVVVTGGATVKFPTGDFVNDAEVVPVGEGQYDLELTGEIGRSLWPRPGYVTGLAGFRFRTKNPENGIDPGDELIWSIEGGYRIRPRLMVKGVLRGLYGFDSRSFGLVIPSLRREIVYLQPGIVFEMDPSRGIEISAPLTVRGRNYPAGAVFSVGFYQRF